MSFKREHPEIAFDQRTDSHNQIHVDGETWEGKPYLDNENFANLMTELGWEAPWTGDDQSYVRSHSGRGGKSLIAIIENKLSSLGLIGVGPPEEQPAPTPAPTPTPTPTPTPAPSGSVDARLSGLEKQVTALEKQVTVLEGMVAGGSGKGFNIGDTPSG